LRLLVNCKNTLWYCFIYAGNSDNSFYASTKQCLKQSKERTSPANSTGYLLGGDLVLYFEVFHQESVVLKKGYDGLV